MNTRIPRFSIWTALLAASLAPSAAHAAWPHDPNAAGLAISTTYFDQQSPSAIPDGAGGAIVVWNDNRTGLSYDIYAQRVNATGVVQWTANGVGVCTAGGDQNLPQICSDGAGGAIITWYDARGGDADIYVQRLNGSGVAQWTLNGVALCTAAGSQLNEQIVTDGSGGAFVAWEDQRSGAFTEIYVRRINSLGAPQWTANGVAVATGGTCSSIMLASDGDFGALIGWLPGFFIGPPPRVQKLDFGGTEQWAPGGVAVSTTVVNSYFPAMVTDGAGGVILAWSDERDPLESGLYAQQLRSNGSRAWSNTGVTLCSAPGLQVSVVLAADGAGGVFAAWEDERTEFDLYAQHLNAASNELWTANGSALCTRAGGQNPEQIIADGTGGAIVAYLTYENGGSPTFGSDLMVTRVDAAGFPVWAEQGIDVNTGPFDQIRPAMVTDGGAGALIFWDDFRNGTLFDLFAQRVEPFGRLGDPGPSITRVSDVSNDQGGRVRIQWTASYLDVAPLGAVDQYWIWREVPAAQAQLALSSGARLLRAGESPVTARGRVLRTSSVTGSPGTSISAAAAPGISAGGPWYWEFVASQVAHGFANYSYTAATLQDSIGASNPYTRFMVEAEETRTGSYWPSSADSGYSVDNLPPVIPAPFSATLGGGANHLHWQPNADVDLAGYRLYRGATSGFTPSPGNLVAALNDTGYADVTVSPYYYKLSAVDAHGNESPFAQTQAPGTTRVEDAPGRGELALAGAWPHPARAGSVIRFALPRAARADLSLYDTSGRRVRRLHSGTIAAGQHATLWDGRDDDGGALSSGIYFLRLETEGRILTRRMVTMN